MSVTRYWCEQASSAAQIFEGTKQILVSFAGLGGSSEEIRFNLAGLLANQLH